MSRSTRGFIRSLVAALLVGAVSAPPAQAVQTSGSIQLIPSQGTSPLNPDEAFSIGVYFRNTSTLTPENPPPPPLPGAPAILSGPISVDLSCLQSCDCSAQSPNEIAFLGCDLAGGLATSCSPGVPGEVLINLPVGGVPLAANDAPVLLATLNLKNNVPLPALLQPHYIRATTEECALRACTVLLPATDCVDCAAEGCTRVTGTSIPPPPFSCKHGCDNKIEFFPQNPALQDSLHVNALFHAPGYDPATQPFALTVSKNGTVIYQVAQASIPEVPPGSGTYILNGPGNNNTPGLTKITITRRTGVGVGGVDCTQDWFKVIVDARGNFSAAAMTDPTIKVSYQLNGQVYEIEDQWKSTSSNAGIKQISYDISTRSPC